MLSAVENKSSNISSSSPPTDIAMVIPNSNAIVVYLDKCINKGHIAHFEISSEALQPAKDIITRVLQFFKFCMKS